LHQLSQTEEYNKALFQMEGAFHELLSLYNVHGMWVFNEQGAVDRECTKIAIQFLARVMGIPDVLIGHQEELISIPLGEEPDD